VPQIILAIICSMIIVSRTRVERVHHVIIGFLLAATIVSFYIEWDILLIENKF
jgi:hypothetical protein